MYDDLASNFDGNCINKKKYIDPNFKCDYPDPSLCPNCNPSESMIDPNSLLFYHILGFQQYVSQTNAIITQLQSQISTIQTQIAALQK